MEVIFTGAVTAVLAAAAFTDIRSRLIPNILPILLLALFAVALFVDPSLRADLPGRLAAGLIVFVVGFALFATGVMGGGDVKLFAALALWRPLGELGGLVFATGLAGAAVGVVYAAMAYFRLRREEGIEAPAGKHLRAALKTDIPYGVAIFIAFMATAFA